MTLRLINGGQPPSLTFTLFDSVLDRTGRRQLQSLVSLSQVERGRLIAEQGEVGDTLIVLADGTVKLWKALPDGRRQIVAFRAAGDLVSLHRCDTPWPVSAQAVSDCALFRIEWQALRRMAGRCPAIERALFDLASDEIASLQERMLMLGRKSSEEKLASFILEFCGPAASPASLRREIWLPMRRPEIAEYLGLTTESVSREFSRLKRERIIAMPRPSRIVVLNRPALEALALGAVGLEETRANDRDLSPARPGHTPAARSAPAPREQARLGTW